jgi:hypothetical protein
LAPRHANAAHFGFFVRTLARRYPSAMVLGGLGAATGCGASDAGQLFGNARSTDDPGSTIVGATGAGGAVAGSGGFSAATGGDGPLPFGSGGDMFVPMGTGGAAPAGGFGGTGSRPPAGPDAGTPPPPALDGGPPPPPMPTSMGCSFVGTWGTLIRVPVAWPAAPFVLNAGAAEVMQWNISHREQDSLLEYHESTSVCGISLPDLEGSVLENNQKFGIRFPNAIFDRGKLPSFVFKTTVSIMGTMIQWSVTDPFAILTGLTMQNPTTTPWPSSFPSSATPDQDGDGASGVTVLPVNPMMDPSYNWPPVGLPPYWGADYPRAARISVVVRSVSTMHGTVASCDELDGNVEIVDIGSSPALNSMVIGCTKIDGEVCSSSEAQFLNVARPVFTPTGPGTLVSLRLPDGAGCQQVREKLPLPH